MSLDMTKKPALSPQEKLTMSRSEIVNTMQKDNHIFDVIKPLVQDYSKSNPFKTLSIAAGLGAAVVFFKPWRFITVGSFIAVLKTLT